MEKPGTIVYNKIRKRKGVSPMYAEEEIVHPVQGVSPQTSR